MSELRLASPPADKPATRPRRKPAVILAAAGAAALAVAIVLALLPGNTPGTSPAATRLLAKIATVAAGQPSPPVRNSQFWYIKSWVSNLVCNGGSGNNCVLEKPHEAQIWQSVSNLCVTGLLRDGGQDTPLKFSTNYLHCPYQGGVHDPTYRFLQSLPTPDHRSRRPEDWVTASVRRGGRAAPRARRRSRTPRRRRSPASRCPRSS